MAFNPEPDQAIDRPTIHLVALSIHLFNPSITPSLVNPDFLRHNEIVEPTWTIARPVTMDQSHSRVRYSNGVAFTAGNNYVAISQNADFDDERNIVTPLTRDNIVCFNAASRYLESISPVAPYDYMSIDPMAWMEINAEDANKLSSPLKGLAAHVPIGEQVPEVQVRAEYHISDKTATIYVSEITPAYDNSALRLVFSGEIVHDLEDEDSTDTAPATVAEILDKWEEDVEFFRELVYQLYSAYIPEEQ